MHSMRCECAAAIFPLAQTLFGQERAGETVFNPAATHLPNSTMKIFTQDAKFLEAGRDEAALEKLLTWHLRQRRWFVAVLLFYVCVVVALAIAGVVYLLPFWHFLHGEGGKVPDLPAGLRAPVINSFTMVLLSLVFGTGIAFRYNEACIKMLLLQRGAHLDRRASGNP